MGKDVEIERAAVSEEEDPVYYCIEKSSFCILHKFKIRISALNRICLL